MSSNKHKLDLVKKVDVEEQTTTISTVELTASDIRKLVGAPDNAEVFIEVPGGGDWSNSDLHVQDKKGHSQLLRVKWKTINTSIDHAVKTHPGKKS